MSLNLYGFIIEENETFLNLQLALPINYYPKNLMRHKANSVYSKSESTARNKQLQQDKLQHTKLKIN